MMCRVLDPLVVLQEDHQAGDQQQIGDEDPLRRTHGAAATEHQLDRLEEDRQKDKAEEELSRGDQHIGDRAQQWPPCRPWKHSSDRGDVGLG
jgi:hypothetical protein